MVLYMSETNKWPDTSDGDDVLCSRTTAPILDPPLLISGVISLDDDAACPALPPAPPTAACWEQLVVGIACCCCSQALLFPAIAIADVIRADQDEDPWLSALNVAIFGLLVLANKGGAGLLKQLDFFSFFQTTIFVNNKNYGNMQKLWCHMK
jgi:hypothetical protein